MTLRIIHSHITAKGQRQLFAASARLLYKGDLFLHIKAMSWSEKRKFYRTPIGYNVPREVEILVQDLNNNKVHKLE